MANLFAPLIIGIGGTARAGSTSERAVRVALEAAESMGARTKMFDGPFLLKLPHYAPHHIERTPEEQEFIAAARECHGMIVGSPGYHGSISGPIKNALDLLEDMNQDDRVYIDGCAMGTIVTAYGWLACGTTMVTLRSIAHAIRAWPTPYGAALNATTPLFDKEGKTIDPKVESQLAIVAQQVVDFARWRHAAGA